MLPEFSPEGGGLDLALGKTFFPTWRFPAPPPLAAAAPVSFEAGNWSLHCCTPRHRYICLSPSGGIHPIEYAPPLRGAGSAAKAPAPSFMGFRKPMFVGCSSWCPRVVFMKPYCTLVRAPQGLEDNARIAGRSHLNFAIGHPLVCEEIGGASEPRVLQTRVEVSQHVQYVFSTVEHGTEYEHRQLVRRFNEASNVWDPILSGSPYVFPPGLTF